MSLRYIILFVALFLSSFGGVGGGRLFAQTGNVIGRLRQDDGEPALGARIFVYTTDGEEIVADANTADDNENKGNFKTGQVKTGMYTLHIKYEGFKRVVITGVPVEDKKSTEINLKLERLEPHEPEEQTFSYSVLFPKLVQPPPPPSSPEKKKEKEKSK